MEQDDFKVSTRTYQTDKSQTIRKMWEVISQRLSNFDTEVVNALKATVSSKSNINNKYGCYGEELYKYIRKQLTNFKNSDCKKINFLINCIQSLKEDEHIEITKKSSKKVIPAKKADIILQNATMDK